MSQYREFEVKRGNVFFRRQKEFKSKLHVLIWKIYMKFKGYEVKEI